MKKGLLILSFALVLSACQKKTEEAPAADAASAPAPTAAAPAPAAEPTDEERARAKKQAALDYATMEDSYLNDPKGQWAKDGTASSTFGETSANGASDSNKPKNLVGKPDGRQWTNDHQDMGFDTLEVSFEKPVHATEVRAVFDAGVEAVSKLEVKGADGTYTTVWSGLNEEPEDQRGPRSWFVRKFEKTATPVQGVKITIANNIDNGYKVVDAVQLVGE
ncbi:MAG TPA: hypothetical protein VMF52_09615 [Steroidobacteraceae bacterium]|nr:hypothetical protein [Steroidobacteraceae bacterium]